MSLSENIWKNTVSSLKENYLLVIAGAIYLSVSCLYISRPGLQYDEALFSSGALGRDGDFVVFRWSVAGHRIPLMLMPYIGAIKAYIYKLVFVLFPPSALTIRLPVIVIGLLALVLTYLLTRSLFGKTAAILTALLLAIDPAYIFHVRADWGPVALMLLFKVGSLYFLTRFVQTRRDGFLALGALFLGLGLYDKANFLWFLFALPLAALLAWRRDCYAFITRRNILTAIKFFSLGCWPWLLYNIAKRGATFRGQVQGTQTLSDAFHYKSALLIDTLNGNAAYQFFNNSDRIGSWFVANGAENQTATLLRVIDFHGTFMPLALLATFLFLTTLFLARRAAEHRAIIFFSVLFISILAQIYLTPRATGSHHMMMLYPIPQMLVAYSIAILFRWRLRSRVPGAFVRAASMCLLVLLILSSVVVDVKYFRSFAATGGKGIWSDAIYQLVDDARQHSSEKLIVMDWGFSNQLELLSSGRIKQEEYFWALLDKSREDQLADELYKKLLKETDIRFIFHAPRYTQFSQPRRIFELMRDRYGLTSETSTVYQRDGEPVYLLEKVQRK